MSNEEYEPFTYKGYIFPFTVQDAENLVHDKTVEEIKEDFFEVFISGAYRGWLGEGLRKTKIPEREFKRANKIFMYAVEAGSEKAKKLWVRDCIYSLMVKHWHDQTGEIIQFSITYTENGGAASRMRKVIEEKFPNSNKGLHLYNIAVHYSKQLVIDIVNFAKEPFTVFCPECGQEYLPKRTGQIYDKRSCAARVGERRRYQSKKNLASK